MTFFNYSDNSFHSSLKTFTTAINFLTFFNLVDQFGQTTLLTFHDIRRRPALPADAFTFTPPAGADVIDADE